MRRRAAADQLAMESALFREAFDRAGLAMVMVDARGVLVRANAAFAALLRRDHAALAGRPIHELVPPGDREEPWIPSGAPGAFHADRRLVRADGEILWVRLTGSVLDEGRHAFAVVADVTARKRAERDLITDLPGAGALEAAAGRHAAAARRYGADGALILLDLDGFQAYNAAHGHHGGDRLLAAAARALRARLRTTDLLVRMGGDEFGVLLPRGTAEEALVVAGHLQRAIEYTGASCSIGVAAFADPDDGAAALDRARSALDEVRRAGGNGVAAALAAR